MRSHGQRCDKGISKGLMVGIEGCCQRRGGGEWVIDGEEEGCRERLNGLEMEDDGGC